MFLVNWFVIIIYQPFLNLLVGTYYLLDMITDGRANMGIAVIVFTVVFRIIWLPVSISSDRSAKEKKEISDQVKEIKQNQSHNPVAVKTQIKTLFRGNRRVVFFSTLNIVLQILIALMLWRLFAKGLLGEDLHLLYPFVPQPSEPFNLFFGDIDLTKPSLYLNFIQSLTIFILEFLTAVFAVYMVKRDMIMTLFILPVVSFLIFIGLPAGKKLFIITTLVFTILFITIRQIYYWTTLLSNKFEKNMEKKFETETKKKKEVKSEEKPEEKAKDQSKPDK